MMTNYTVDQLLGDHEKRYFGNGYKKVTHKLCQLRLSNGIWECFGQVKRVKDWSKKNSLILSQHLSSIDGLILGMLLVEKVLQQNPLMEVKNWFLYAFEIKAGSKPVENIDSIQIYIKSIQLESSSFKAEIVEEDMNVKLYFVNLRPTAIVPISTNIFTNYTENHLNNKAHDIKQIEFLSRLQLQALAHIFEDGQKSIFTGLQSNHQYLTSLLDWLVVFAQMGEILAYHYDNLKRDESGNF